jgi:hypothetical protein
MYILYIFPPSSIHLWLRCSNFFNPSKKNSFGCVANWKIRKVKNLSAPLRSTYGALEQLISDSRLAIYDLNVGSSSSHSFHCTLMQGLSALINLHFTVFTLSPRTNAVAASTLTVRLNSTAQLTNSHHFYAGEVIQEVSHHQRWLDSSRTIYTPSGGTEAKSCKGGVLALPLPLPDTTICTFSFCTTH